VGQPGGVVALHRQRLGVITLEHRAPERQGQEWGSAHFEQRGMVLCGQGLPYFAARPVRTFRYTFDQIL
jgi:hypothetical protein